MGTGPLHGASQPVPSRPKPGRPPRGRDRHFRARFWETVREDVEHRRHRPSCGNSTPGRNRAEKRGPGGGRRSSGAPGTRSTERIVTVGRGPRTRRIGLRGTTTNSWPTRSSGTRRGRRRHRESGRDAEDAGGARAGTLSFDCGTLGRESCGFCGIRPFLRPTTRPKGICGCGRCTRRSPAALTGSEPGARDPAVRRTRIETARKQRWNVWEALRAKPESRALRLADS